MVEGTSRARIQRALNTRTLPAGQAAQYQVGDQVEYHRPQGKKDISGWFGLATICDMTRLERGVTGVRHQNKVLDVRLADMRHWSEFYCLLAAPGSPSPFGHSLTYVLTAISRMPVNKPLSLGWWLMRLGK